MHKILSTSFCSLLLLIAGFGWNASNAQAQSITFSYNFDAQTLVGTSTDPGATANDAVYGPGLGTKTYFTGNPGYAVAGDGFASGTPLNTANNDYFGFPLSTGTCKKVTLTSLSFDGRRSGTGPANLEIRSSADGFATAVFTATLSGTNFESKSGAITSLTISGGQTLTFRIYGYNATGSTGTLRIDNVTFRGTITDDLPTAFAVTGGGAVCPPLGLPVGLSGSQTGIDYQLNLSGAPIGAPVAGTGAAISFGDQTSFGTYTVVASNGNGCTKSQTGSATITQSANCGGGECSILLNTTQVNVLCNGNTSGAIDLSPSGGTPAYTYAWSNGQSTQDLSNLGAGTYTVTVTDAGNCSKTVSVTITQPAAISLSLTSVNPSSCFSADGSIDLSALFGTAPYTYDWSNDGPESPDNDPQDLQNLASGIYTVTVTDANNCSATKSVSLEVFDTTPPSITCPANTNIVADANCSSAIGAFAPTSLSDNCTENPVVVQYPGSSTLVNSSNPVQLVTLTATDLAGNSQSCSFTVTLVDVTKPSISCPQDQIVNANAACSGTVGAWSPVSLSDNCTSNPSVTQSPASDTPLTGNNDSRMVTLTATDNANNTQTCSFQVTLKDVTNPELSCPANVTLNADANCSAVLGAYAPASAGDNCSGNPSISQSPDPSTILNGHNSISIVTLTASDAAGNSQSCTFSVTLKDVTPPTIVCKSINADLNENGTVSIVPTDVYESGFDNCGAIRLYSVFPNTFTCNHLGPNLVTLATSDEYGNRALCTATVTVRDQILPVAKCKDITANLGVNGMVNIDASALNNASTDNCSFTLSVSPATLNCANIGLNVVTLRATDQAGNTATCTSVVSVSDLVAPSAKCKKTTIYLNDSGHATLTVADVNNNSSDACGIANMNIDVTEFNCSELPGSSWPVTLSLTDVNGNTATCLANVTVKDAIAPTAICQNLTVYLDANGIATVYGDQLAINSIDNCSVWAFAPIARVYTAANLGNNNLTISVRDWSGNASTCVSVVTVLPYSGQRPGNDRSVEQLPNQGTFSVYPNPTSGDVNLAFELAAEQAVQIRVFDIQGRLVLSHAALGLEGENNLSLRLEGFAAGLYILDFQSTGITAQKRLMIRG